MEIAIEAKPMPTLWILMAQIDFPAGGNSCLEVTAHVLNDSAELELKTKEFTETIEKDDSKVLKMMVYRVDQTLIDKLCQGDKPC